MYPANVSAPMVQLKQSWIAGMKILTAMKYVNQVDKCIILRHLLIVKFLTGQNGQIVVKIAEKELKQDKELLHNIQNIMEGHVQN